MNRLFFVFLFFVVDTTLAQQRKDCFINLTEPLKSRKQHFNLTKIYHWKHLLNLYLNP